MIAHVAVVIPAANEQAHIAACLTSVKHATFALSAVRPHVTVDVVVVLDSCTDDTAGIVAETADVTAVISDVRNVDVADLAAEFGRLRR